MNNRVVKLGLFAALAAFGGFMYMPFVSPLIKSVLEGGVTYGIPVDIWLGIFAAIGPLSLILGTHFIGSLSDEVGRKKVAYAGLSITFIGILLYLTTNNPLVFLLARACDLLGYSTVLMVTLAKANDLTKQNERGKQQGVFLSLSFLGSVFGPLAGAYLATNAFPKAPFVASIFVVLILFSYLLSTKKEKFKPEHSSSFSIYHNWKKFLGFRQLKGMAVLGMTMHAHAPLLIFFLPVYILQLFPGRYDFVGYSMVALGVLKPFQWIIGNYVDRFGKAKLTIVGCLIVGLSLLLIPLAHTIWQLLLVLVLFSGGGAVWNIGAWTIMSTIGEANHIEGHIIGSYTSISKVGDLIASLSFGLIAFKDAYADLFSIGGYIVLVGILLSLFFLRDITSLKRTDH